jgi:hypothetical protein
MKGYVARKGDLVCGHLRVAAICDRSAPQTLYTFAANP